MPNSRKIIEKWLSQNKIKYYQLSYCGESERWSATIKISRKNQRSDSFYASGLNALKFIEDVAVGLIRYGVSDYTKYKIGREDAE